MCSQSITHKLHKLLLKTSTTSPKQTVLLNQLRNPSISEADPVKIARLGEGGLAHEEKADPGEEGGASSGEEIEKIDG